MLERAFCILKILKENTNKDNPLSLKDIIEQIKECGFTASRGTVGKDIEILMRYDEKINEVKGRSNKSFYYYEGAFSLQECRLILDSVYSRKFIKCRDKDRIREKILKNQSLLERNKIKNKIKITTIDTGTVDVMENLFLLHQAISDKRKVDFTTVTRGYDNKMREVKRVEGFISKEILSHNYRDYVIGINNCGELRNYRIDRIDNIELGELHINSEKISLERYQIKNFDMFIGDEEEVVEFRVCKSLINSVVETFGDDISIHKDYSTEGCFIVSLKVGINKGLVRWIMKQGRDLKVTFPEKLVEKVKEELEKTIKNYY